MLNQNIKVARKLARTLGAGAVVVGYLVLVLRLPGEQSPAGRIGYCFFVSGVLLMLLGLPRPSIAQLIWIITLIALLLLGMVWPRWMGAAFLAPYLLATILRAPQGFTLLRRALSHWRQTLRELNAASKDEALPH